jgi:hypothetical protein
MRRPDHLEFAPFFQDYIELVPEGNFHILLRNRGKDFFKKIKSIPIEKGNFSYSEGKWTVLQLLQHINDTERIFSFRALWFLREDRTQLPGFNENHFAEVTHFPKRNIKDLAEEFASIRSATSSLFKKISEKEASKKGSASGRMFTVRSIGYIILGHQLHHEKVMRDKYQLFE